MSGFQPFVATHIPYSGFLHTSFIPAAIPAPLPSAQSGLGWVEHVSHDGRKYYYNTFTQQTTWEKPQELRTLQEKILANCPWKEFTSESGKVYYYNESTQQSVWVKPQELVDAENQASLALPNAKSNNNITMTPCTPATPKEEKLEPSEIEKAMQATLASFDPPEVVPEPMPIPLPPDPTLKLEEDEKPPVSASTEYTLLEYKTRGEMAEGLRRLFRDCNVPGGSTWEQALKLINGDPRYNVLKSFNEKKQIFNVYKTQKLKEEKEEQRIRVKQAKEDLDRFLLQHPEIQSTMSYRRVDQLLAEEKQWTTVPDRDRREIFEDVIQEIAKREREEAKILRKRNIKVFNEILSDMADLNYRTTWSEVQQMLLDNVRFTSDEELQNLDKEDALICFEEHICMLEQEHDESKEHDRRKQKREQRKNREAFIVLLDELHEQKYLTSVSLWKDLYHIIKNDERFHKMLAQRGSTPLDLFKFYVEILKARYPAEKKIIKEILKSNNVVDVMITYEEFRAVILADERSKDIDEGSIKITFNNLIEKAQGRERERLRDDARRFRKVEQSFSELLSSAGFIVPTTSWEEVREKLGEEPAFKNMTLESERIRIFKEHLLSIEPTLNDESRRSKKEKHIREKSVSSEEEVINVVENSTDKKKKLIMSPRSPVASEASLSEKSDNEEISSNRKHKHHKSKKSKHRKSKHKRRKSSERRSSVQKEDELEEGEADDDEDDDEGVNNHDGSHKISKRRKNRRRDKRSKTSGGDDAEEHVNGSDENCHYDKETKRKKH